jgi:hypothetical protein
VSVFDSMLDIVQRAVVDLGPVWFTICRCLEFTDEAPERKQDFAWAAIDRKGRFRVCRDTFRCEVEPHANAACDRLEMQEIAVWFEVPPDACSATARGSVQRVDQVLDRVVGDVRRIDLDADAVDRKRQPKPPVDGWFVVDADAWSGGQARYLVLIECTASTSAAT